jgi:hypothetical protein
MPIERKPIGVSQLCELLGVDVGRFISIVPDPCARNTGQRDSSRWWILMEPDAKAEDSNAGKV